MTRWSRATICCFGGGRARLPGMKLLSPTTMPTATVVVYSTQVRSYSLGARWKTKLMYLFPFLRAARYFQARERIVILGTGWGSMHFLKYLNPHLYDVTVVSPRNYFTFTPLLPAVSAGTLSPLSCIEPARNFMRRGADHTGKLYEGVGKDIDIQAKRIWCVNDFGDTFHVDYDHLVVGIGCDTDTQGVPGVDKYGLLLKEVEHAIRIRKTIINLFERASLPDTPEKEKIRLLHFVGIGGGPTGVETMSEIADFVEEDMKKNFPEVASYVRLTLIEMQQRLLSTFSRPVSEYANQALLRNKVNVLTGYRVVKLLQKSITLEDLHNRRKTTTVRENPHEPQKTPMHPRIEHFPYGLALWSVGVGPAAFTQVMKTKVPEQGGTGKFLRVNERLELIGADNVYAIGDCKQIEPPKLVANIDKIIADNNGQILTHNTLLSQQSRLKLAFPQAARLKSLVRKSDYVPDKLSRSQLQNLLEKVDNSYKSPAPTAQNARHEGLYLAAAFNDFPNTEDRRTQLPAFTERWWGSLAYVGRRKAVVSLPWNIDIRGEFYSYMFWKTVYIVMQLSARARAIVMFDWFKFWFSGRDVGRDHVFIPGETWMIRRATGEGESAATVTGEAGSEEEIEDEEMSLTPPLTRALNPSRLREFSK